MKKTIGFLLPFLLVACASPPKKGGRVPLTDQPLFTQKIDTAPWPWVRIIPSERAAQFQEVDFAFICRLLRHNMVPHPEKFSKISLILIDYTILPAEPPLAPKKSGRGISFCEKYITKPEHYFLEIRFYTGNTRPPAPPSYMGTVVMTPRTAPLQEAIRHMMDVLVFELGCYSARRIHLSLDAATGGSAPTAPKEAPKPTTPPATAKSAPKKSV